MMDKLYVDNETAAIGSQARGSLLILIIAAFNRGARPGDQGLLNTDQEPEPKARRATCAHGPDSDLVGREESDR